MVRGSCGEVMRLTLIEEKRPVQPPNVHDRGMHDWCQTEPAALPSSASFGTQEFKGAFARANTREPFEDTSSINGQAFTIQRFRSAR